MESMFITCRARLVEGSSTKVSTRSCRFPVAKMKLSKSVGHSDSRISCKLTRGCFNQVASSLVPWAVLHLFKRPNSVDDLLRVPCGRVSRRGYAGCWD